MRRVYLTERLNLRVSPKKQFPTRHPMSLAQPEATKKSWSVDFMSDRLQYGRTLRAFKIIDDYNREVLAIEIDTLLPSGRVMRILEKIASWWGYLRRQRSGNGPEFSSQQLARWVEKDDVLLSFIEPVKPAQTDYIERFNRTYRKDVSRLLPVQRPS